MDDKADRVACRRVRYLPTRPYGNSGTEIAYVAMLLTCPVAPYATIRAPYAMSGTTRAYAYMSAYVSGTAGSPLRDHTTSPVLTWRMLRSPYQPTRVLCDVRYWHSACYAISLRNPRVPR
eukprot:2913821-Rhodomonas_salina.1